MPTQNSASPDDDTNVDESSRAFLDVLAKQIASAHLEKYRFHGIQEPQANHTKDPSCSKNHRGKND